jgi:dihydroneopterin aldolase
MMTYTEIRQQAIQLPLEERARLIEDLVATLVEAAAQRWDDQITADIQAGRLDDIADAVLADFDAGHCTPL